MHIHAREYEYDQLQYPTILTLTLTLSRGPILDNAHCIGPISGRNDQG